MPASTVGEEEDLRRSTSDVGRRRARRSASAVGEDRTKPVSPVGEEEASASYWGGGLQEVGGDVGCWEEEGQEADIGCWGGPDDAGVAASDVGEEVGVSY